MDEQYIAFLLLESMYKSGKINKATYENVLKEKRKYIEEKYNIDGNAFSLAVRPVISIDKCAIVKSGDGSPSKPYEIEMN